MNAIVEVATAQTVAKSNEVYTSAIMTHFTSLVGPTPVATSTLCVPSVGGHSISAVTPDNTIFRKELAVA
jgi:hypothetical protein